MEPHGSNLAGKTLHKELEMENRDKFTEINLSEINTVDENQNDTSVKVVNESTKSIRNTRTILSR
jgi:PleD family two-component response regulator